MNIKLLWYVLAAGAVLLVFPVLVPLLVLGAAAGLIYIHCMDQPPRPPTAPITDSLAAV